jgi:hypothetical protein
MSFQAGSSFWLAACCEMTVGSAEIFPNVAADPRESGVMV